jgi:hypothetical protein
MLEFEMLVAVKTINYAIAIDIKISLALDLTNIIL